jgi:hypothetical protein
LTAQTTREQRKLLPFCLLVVQGTQAPRNLSQF